MSGAYVVHALLRANASLIAVVPAARMHYGYIPVASGGSIALPAILVNEISGRQRNVLSMDAATYLQTDRIQVSCYAATYLLMRSLMDLARKACGNTRSTVATIAVESVIYEGRGPDLSDSEAGIFIQSFDLMVTWRASS